MQGNVDFLEYRYNIGNIVSPDVDQKKKGHSFMDELKDALDMMASLDYNFFCCVCGCIPESKQDNEYQWQRDYAF